MRIQPYERKIARHCNLSARRTVRLMRVLFGILTNTLCEKGRLSVRDFGRWKAWIMPPRRCGNPPFVKGHCWRRGYVRVDFNALMPLRRRLRAAGVAYLWMDYQERGRERQKAKKNRPRPKADVAQEAEPSRG